MDPSSPINTNAVEDELCRISYIRAASVELDRNEEPVVVHIIATKEKEPKHVVRDVQTTMKAVFGVTVDRRIVSVVQYDAQVTNGSDEHAAIPESARVLVDSIKTDSDTTISSAEVILRRGVQIAAGRAEADITESSTPTLVAQATLRALRELEPKSKRIAIETASIAHFGDRSVAVVTLLLAINNQTEIVAGSAVVRDAGEHDAIARALLDGTNRRLPQLS